MRGTLRVVGLGLAVLAAWWIASCSKSPIDILIPNHAPTVALSAGPIRDSVEVYIVTFNWNASDGDGQVVRFLYAIDDTLSPGAWFETTRYELTLFLNATRLAGVDSIRIGRSDAYLERYRFRDAHTFYLKAVDDDGAISAPAALSFTAQTFAPETRILIPDPRGIVALGRTFTVSWQGTDLDGTENPVGYSYRRVRVENVILFTAAQAESALYDPTSQGEPWSAFTPQTSVTLRDLETPAEYLLGVVALDQAGAVEPRLRISGLASGPPNVLLIRATVEAGHPHLVVCSSIKCLDFPSFDEQRNTIQIPANTNLTFTWDGDASDYGGTITGYTHGIDLLDPAAESPEDPGWAPESASLTRAVLRFDIPEGSQGEEHIFYVRARDNVGSSTIARINLIVVPLTGDRDVLYVDDFGPDAQGNAPSDCVHSLPLCTGNPPPCISPSVDMPQDQCHDQFFRERLERALDQLGHPEWVVDRYEPLKPDGTLNQREPVADSTSNDYWVYNGLVTLENLARYKLVVWNVKAETNSMLRFMNREGNDNFLAAFVEAGGDVWIEGTGPFSRTRQVDATVFGFLPGEFLHRFHKIESVFEGNDCVNGCFRSAGQSGNNVLFNGFDGGYASQMAILEGYPESLRVGRPPFNSPLKGVPSCEGMVVPLGLDINPRLRLFGGRLDTLYFYQSNGFLQRDPPVRSYLDDAATALRYSGPGQGRMMVYGFPLYFLPNEADAIMVASLRWFLEP